MQNTTRLYGVPPPIQSESLASWITRAALSQACSVRDICKYLRISDIDIDLFLGENSPTRLAANCNLTLDSFDIVQKIMTNLTEIDPNGANYLLFEDKKAISRFCPLCLKTDQIPYFRLEWRFVAWRWCPLHNCLLEDVCGNCNRAVQLPFNLMYVALKNAQAWNLSYCKYCQQSLTDNVPSEIHFKHMSATDADMLTNGRALLSALYFGYYHSTQNEEKRSLSGLKTKNGRGLSLADVLGLTVRTMSI
jgi:hypothetical protein